MRNEQKTKRQHAVPQNIMEVEFKLIGDMTVRQFLYVASGGFLCYLAYTGGLPFLIRWFLILLIASLALGMAFLPMEERGLDEWIRNFFAACYSPTQRMWKKSEVRRKKEARVLPPPPKKPPERKEERRKKPEKDEVIKITEELKNAVRETEGKRLSEKDLTKRAEKISRDLDRILAEIARPKEEVPERSLREENQRLKEKLRELSGELEKLKKLERMEGVSPDVERTMAFHREKMTKLEEKTKSLEEELAREREKEEEREERFAGEEEYRKQVRALEEENKALGSRIDQATREIERLKEETEKLSEEKGDYAQNLREKEEELRRLEEERNRAVSKLLKLSQKVRGLKEFREEIPEEVPEAREPEKPKPPEKPKIPEKPKPEEIPSLKIDIPNVINGVVKDKEGKLLPGMMVVVEDEDGDPVRALKTNKLGQFPISTPLPNGNYTVRVESKERKFSPVKVTCDGSILKAIVFREQ